jgi:SHAQKYF class myb-like DNA-binding protein
MNQQIAQSIAESCYYSFRSISTRLPGTTQDLPIPLITTHLPTPPMPQSVLTQSIFGRHLQPPSIPPFPYIFNPTQWTTPLSSIYDLQECAVGLQLARNLEQAVQNNLLPPISHREVLAFDYFEALKARASGQHDSENSAPSQCCSALIENHQIGPESLNSSPPKVLSSRQHPPPDEESQKRQPKKRNSRPDINKRLNVVAKCGHPAPARATATTIQDSADSGDCSAREGGGGGGGGWGVRWTRGEHEQFLEGLERFGIGQWCSIARHCVPSRSPAQIASHHQKFAIRSSLPQERRQKTSLLDMTTPTVRSLLAQRGSDP